MPNQSLDYKHLTLDQDYSVEELNALVGSEVRALPQIFIEDDGQVRYVGDYNALRSELQKSVAALSASSNVEVNSSLPATGCIPARAKVFNG